MAKKTKYKFMWGQRQSAMFAEYMLLNFAVRNKEFTITKGIDDVLREHNKGFSYIYFSEDSIQRGFKNSRCYLEKKFAKSILSKIDKHMASSIKFFAELRENNFNNLSKKQTFSLVKKYAEQFLFGQKLFRASDPSSTKAVEDKLKSILSKRYKEEELMEKFINLVTPTDLDKTQQELIDFYGLVINKKRLSKNILLKHIFKYPANYANVWSYEEILSFLQDKITKADVKKLEAEIEQIKLTKNNTQQKQKEILREFNNNPDLIYYSYLLRTLSLKRFELKHSWAGGETLSLDFLSFLSSEIGLNLKSFMEAYNFSDIFNYYERGVKLTDKEITERREYSVIHYQKSKLLYLYGQKAKSYFIKKYSLKNVDELKGMIANKGIISGVVRVIKVDDLSSFIQDSKDFKDGEILVTTMTSPIMLSLASKAAAIVTNEGGVCSHAAVISRELKIPCIVGTHDATNIFKTGDKVEVNADNGIVRKL